MLTIASQMRKSLSLADNHAAEGNMVRSHFPHCIPIPLVQNPPPPPLFRALFSPQDRIVMHYCMRRHCSCLIRLILCPPPGCAGRSLVQASAHLITYRGLAADRNERAMAGSAFLGRAIADMLKLNPQMVSAPQPLVPGAWPDQLQAARPSLLQLSSSLRAAFEVGHHPITTLNRCTASIATLPVVAAYYPGIKLVWFDAHGDCNTPSTTPGGYLGGMVLTAAAGMWDTGLGAGFALSDITLVGSRDLDPAERDLIGPGKITLVAPGREIASRLRDVLSKVPASPVYAHLDCDVLEPDQVPTEYRVPGGLMLGELHACMDVLTECNLVGFETAEFEATWPGGSQADHSMLIEAISPVLHKLMKPAGPRGLQAQS